jgi:dTDP-4-dehydrorhamnose reductase
MANGPILITGGSGQIGGALVRQAKAQGIAVFAPDRQSLNLTDGAAIDAAVGQSPWSAVINCAAYTAVDRAETEAELAYAINAEAPAHFAQATQRRGIPLIHVSTDYVFDGRKATAYEESDPVNPVSVYGRTKEAGEAAVRAIHPNHAIIRTAWVLSATGANFLNTMIRLASERSELKVVNDQIGCPSSADDIAAALLDVAMGLKDRSGTWHVVNAGETSWHGLAAHIFAHMEQRGLATPKLTAILTSDYPTPSARPANSRLATDALAQDFGIILRPWQKAVDEILAERLGPNIMSHVIEDH